MKRRMYGALVGTLGLAMSVGAVLTGAGTAGAATATTAAKPGTVTLTPRSDSLTDGSPFTRISVNKACPMNYQDALSVYLVLPDGSESGIAFSVADGGPFNGSRITAALPAEPTDTTFVTSISEAFGNANATPADGTYPIHVVCANADQGAFPERPAFTGFIDVTGATWKPSSRPAPAATRIKVAATPSGHVQVGQTLTLKAMVTPAVPGTVQFTANGFNPVGDPVQVVNGVATVPVPTVGRPTPVQYTATFVPADQLAYAQAYGVLDYAFTAAPTITVKDASGAVLTGTPQLAPGQQITVSATGFLPGGGEPVYASIPNVCSFYPPVLADADGSLTDYAVTIPSRTANGSHKLVLKGGNSAIKITFAFTTKRP